MHIVLYCPECGTPAQVYDEMTTMQKRGAKVRRRIFEENGHAVHRIYFNNKLEHSCITELDRARIW